MRAERQILVWAFVALVFVALIALLREILLPFIAGIAIAYFLSPVADRMVSAGVPRVLASAFIVGLVAVIIVVGMVALLPVLVDQSQQLVAAAPQEFERLKGILEAWARERFGAAFPGMDVSLSKVGVAIADNWASLAGWLVNSVFNRGLALVNFVAFMLVTPLVVFYLLVDWHAMLNKIDGWLPRDHAPGIRRIAADVNEAIAAFVRGQGTVCIILGVFYAAALSSLGLNYGLLVGLVTGVLAFVPFAGWALGLIVSMGIAVVQFWPDPVGPSIVLLIFLTGQALDAAFLSPQIVGQKIGLHPVWLIFSLFAFSFLLGFVGTLIAVPVSAAICVVLRHGLQAYLASDLYMGRGGARADGGTGQGMSQ